MAGPFEFVLSRCVRRGMLAACAPRRARGPANAHANPMTCAWVRHLAREPDDVSVGSAAHAHIRGLTLPFAGLHAYQGGHAHIQRFACEVCIRPGAVERR